MGKEQGMTPEDYSAYIESQVEQAQPKIAVDPKSDRLSYMGPKNYADYYAGKSGDWHEQKRAPIRKAQIEAVAREISTNPDATFDFELRAGESESSRNFSAAFDNLQGYCAVLAQAAFDQGYNLQIIVDIDGQKREYGRMGTIERTRKHSQRPYQVYDRLPDDPEKPTKYLLIQEKPKGNSFRVRYIGDDRIYSNGALIGYRLRARVVETNPIESQE
jgi:hypothetical protein